MKMITLSGVGKSFLIPHEKRDTLKENILNFLKKRTYEHFDALKEINLEVKKGEFVGIMGKNGSGKSTLLKIIAGIYKPDTGRVSVAGSIAPFLELGIGFQPELTARENIIINGTLLDLSSKQIEQKLQEMVSFAEIENFLDLKIKNFSSGMQARLAFAIATQADSDIYLCDEVLAVGDEGFQQKCIKVFENWKKQGKTLILVSHNPAFIRDFCDRAVLLEKGKMVVSGKAENVIHEYHRRLNLEGKNEQAPADFSDSDLQITDVRFYDQQGMEQSNFSTGDGIVARIFYELKRPVEKPVFGVAIHRDDGTHVTGPNTKTSQFSIAHLQKDGFIDCMIKNNNLLGGRYLLSASCFDDSCTRPYDYADKKFTFTVQKNRENQYGIMEMPVTWKLHE